MVRVAGSNGNPIPLTLSPGEREQPAAGSIVREVRPADTAMGFAERQRKILPLPEGDGRGEGKSDASFANRAGTPPEVRASLKWPYGFESFIRSCLPLCRRSLAFLSSRYERVASCSR